MKPVDSLLAGMLACTLMVAWCSPQQPTASAAHEPATGVTPASRAAPPARLLARRVQAPDAAFLTAGGQAVTLQKFAGRVVVLNLWASWCTPCVREMPSLDALAQREHDIAVVAVSMDVQGPQVASEFLRRKRLDHLDAYHDPDAGLMRALGVFGLPVSVVIDREGRVAATIQGEVDWNAAGMRDLLARV